MINSVLYVTFIAPLGGIMERRKQIYVGNTGEYALSPLMQKNGFYVLFNIGYVNTKSNCGLGWHCYLWMFIIDFMFVSLWMLF